MAPDPLRKPSFSPYRRWAIGLQVVLLIFLVFSVVVMVNYLGRQYPFRFHVNSREKNPLSPLTIRFLRSLTNQVQVTVYYDREDGLYSTIVDLLNEYRLANSKISFRTVDYKRDAGAAQQLQLKYPQVIVPGAKNLIIFDCNGRIRALPGGMLEKTTIEPTSDKEVPYRLKVLAFAGEKAFTSLLMAVTSSKTLTACFLKGHGEHTIEQADELNGYSKFALLLQQNIVQPQVIDLLGTNTLSPGNCNLLIVAGPTRALPEADLEKIDHYLEQGGRLLVLFNSGSVNKETGLEKLLAKWGVAVGNNIVIDPEHSPNPGMEEMIVSAFADHPITNPLLLFGLEFIRPRTIGDIKSRTQGADAPKVRPLVFSGAKSYLQEDPLRRQLFPLAVAVEKGAIKDVVTERGTTRMVVIGDSFCFANRLIDSETWKNRDFASYVINWLLDRPQLLNELGPRPVAEYRLVMTKAQLQSAEWILLGGMPGVVLVVGTLVWFRRRR